MSIPITKGNAACKILLYYFLIVKEIHFMGIKIVFLLAPTWYRRFRVYSNEIFNIYISQSDKNLPFEKCKKFRRQEVFFVGEKCGLFY